MARAAPITYRNQILSRLSSRDLALIAPSLTPLALPARKSLQKPEAPITDIYFVEAGIVSVVAVGAKRAKRVEAGIIGPEGVTGIEVILADNRSQHDVYMQVGGSGYRLPAADFVRAMARSKTLQRILLRFAASYLMQVTETALANGSATIDARLSRWLLMAQDRLADATLPLTHEFLALMLGVRRAGVTVTLQELTREGLIKSGRANVVIVDRRGLMAHAGGIYGRSQSELRRLMAKTGASR